MKKIRSLLCLYILLLFFILCVFEEGVSQTAIHSDNMLTPYIFSQQDSAIYICVQYTLSYPKKPNTNRYITREICSCYQTNIDLLEWRKNYHSYPNTYGFNTVIVWDKDFVNNYILPLFRDEKDRKRIEYTLANSNDSTFKNIIDYANKVIIDDKMYYYPINTKTYIMVTSVNYEWFKSIVPQSLWMYESSCFYDGERMKVSLLIPLLDKE